MEIIFFIDFFFLVILNYLITKTWNGASKRAILGLTTLALSEANKPILYWKAEYYDIIGMMKDGRQLVFFEDSE